MHTLDLQLDVINQVRLEQLAGLAGMAPEEFLGLFLDCWVGTTRQSAAAPFLCAATNAA